LASTEVPDAVAEQREDSFGVSLEEVLVDSAGASARRNQTSQRTRALAVVVFCVALLTAIGVWDASSIRAESDAEPEAAPISVFTLVATGIVFVEPEFLDIVWKNNRGNQKTIGDVPWRNRGTARPSDSTGSPAWRDHREIVGNPDHDLVSWVETTDGQRGDLLVVEASTGVVLARTPIRAPANHHVVVASIDDETVHFATPEPGTGYPDVPGGDMWVWRWPAGEVPENLGDDRFYNDVSAGTWAVYGRNGVEFEDENRRTLSTVAFPEGRPTDLGGALSPDGAYWYGAGTSQIADTATGMWSGLQPDASGTTGGRGRPS
jgi:hypothetical protein